MRRNYVAKYSPEALKAMATVVLEEEKLPVKSAGPLHLYITVAQRTGLQPTEVRERIIAMAEGPLDVKV